MGRTVTLERWLADSAILGILAPATLILMGHARARAFNSRLGLHDPAALPGSSHLMISGFNLLWQPVLWLVLIYALAWVIVSIQARKPAKPFAVREIPLLAWAAAAALAAALEAFISIGDETPTLIQFIDFTLLDLVVTLVLAALLTVLIVGPFSKNIAVRVIIGRTFTGTILLGMLVVGGLTLQADFAGKDAGSKIAWGCAPYPGIQVATQALNIDENKTYVFIAHSSGFLYVRNPDLDGNVQEIESIPDASIHSTTHRTLKPVRDC